LCSRLQELRQGMRAVSRRALPTEQFRASSRAQGEFDTSIKRIAKAMRDNRKSPIAASSDDEYYWA